MATSPAVKCGGCGKDIQFASAGYQVNGQILCLNCYEKRKPAERANLAESKFQTAIRTGQAISATGWALVVLSAFVSLIVLVAAGGNEKLIAILPILVGGPIGLLVVVAGQLLQAVVFIENNTDRAAQLLEVLAHPKALN